MERSESHDKKISVAKVRGRERERKWKKGTRETPLATEKFPSREREGDKGALEREERKGKKIGINSGKREREGEKEREREREREREERLWERAK